MGELYTVNKQALVNIADAIRYKYDFNDKLTLEEMPFYISSQTNMFWVTHFNEQEEGGGIIITDASILSSISWPWHVWIAFQRIDSITNGYEIVNKLDYILSETAEQTLEIPEGGFIYGLSLGSDYSASGGPNYNSGFVSTAVRRALEW